MNYKIMLIVYNKVYIVMKLKQDKKTILKYYQQKYLKKYKKKLKKK